MSAGDVACSTFERSIYLKIKRWFLVALNVNFNASLTYSKWTLNISAMTYIFYNKFLAAVSGIPGSTFLPPNICCFISCLLSYFKLLIRGQLNINIYIYVFCF